ncbi:MAG: efflux RND transporter periplasmic adaptor subunit [Phycisphaerales bacterium]|nr:MAG: efflux RND transporter periplasmic adaptor subunit [Phycisphaerales bacterium]
MNSVTTLFDTLSCRFWQILLICRREHCGLPCVLWLVAAVLAGLPAIGYAQGQPAPVSVDEVKQEIVQQRRQVTGNLRAINRSRVASIEPGLIVEVPTEEGQTVSRGDVLARLDARRLEIRLRQLEAQMNVTEAVIEERRAQVELRQNDLDTLINLEQRGAVNPKEVSDGRSELRAAEARATQAEEELNVQRADADFLRQRLEDMVITAPYDGVIIVRHTEVGEWVGEGQPIVEMLSIGEIEVWLDVPQRYLAATNRSDLRTMVRIEATGDTREARSPRIVRDIDPTSRTFSLVMRLQDEDGLLSPGMSVIANVPTGEEQEHLTIHKDALIRQSGGSMVYVARENEEGSLIAAPVTVSTVFETPDRLVVRSPELQPGDRVVVEGNERLRPMQPVRIVDPDAPQAARFGDDSSGGR